MINPRTFSLILIARFQSIYLILSFLSISLESTRGLKFIRWISRTSACLLLARPDRRRPDQIILDPVNLSGDHRTFLSDRKSVHERERRAVGLSVGHVSVVVVVMGGGQPCFLSQDRPFAEDSLLPAAPPFSCPLPVNN